MSSLTLTSPGGPPFLTSGLVISESSDFFASFVDGLDLDSLAAPEGLGLGSLEAGLDLDSLAPGLALLLSLAAGLALSLGLVLPSLAAGLVLLSLGLAFPLVSFSFGLALSLGLTFPSLAAGLVF